MRHHARARSVVARATRVFTSPDDLLHDIQSTLAAVADIEYRYERDCERIEKLSLPEATKAHLLAECKDRRCREREPYLRKIEAQQQRLRAHLPFGL